MDYWLTEELMWLAWAEREREIKELRLHAEVDKLQANWTIVAQVALKLSDWLIITGERIQRRYGKSIPASPWVENRKFAH